MRFLLDTNICVYLLKRRPAAVCRRLEAEAPSDVAISAITRCELAFGVARSAPAHTARNRLALSEFVRPFRVLDFPGAAAAHFGRIKAQLFAAGTPIGPFDLLIAAHALHEGLTLVTNNVREFERIPGLSLENWAL